MPLPMLAVPGGTSPGAFVPAYAEPGFPVLQDSYVIFAAPGISNRDAHWYGSVVTDDITIFPNNPGISQSASMFLDNGNGQVWEFFSDHSGNFGVFDKTLNNEAFEMTTVSSAGTYYDVTINGGLKTGGGVQGKLFTQTAGSVTLGTEDYTTLLNGTTTCQLPSAASKTGQILTVKQIAAGAATVTTTSSQTIDGAATYALSAQYKYVTVQSDGSNWFVIASN